MAIPDVYDNINSSTSYTFYDQNGQYGCIPDGDALPPDSTVVATGVSGSEIQKQARDVRKNRLDEGQQTEQNAQQEEEQMSAQYLTYLLGYSPDMNLCTA